MAKNLRAKIPKSDTIIVHDVNKEITAKFAKEHEGTEVAHNVREVAEKSVRTEHSLLLFARCYVMN